MKVLSLFIGKYQKRALMAIDVLLIFGGGGVHSGGVQSGGYLCSRIGGRIFGGGGRTFRGRTFRGLRYCWFTNER